MRRESGMIGESQLYLMRVSDLGRRSFQDFARVERPESRNDWRRRRRRGRRRRNVQRLLIRLRRRRRRSGKRSRFDGKQRGNVRDQRNLVIPHFVRFRGREFQRRRPSRQRRVTRFARMSVRRIHRLLARFLRRHRRCCRNCGERYRQRRLRFGRHRSRSSELRVFPIVSNGMEIAECLDILVGSSNVPCFRNAFSILDV